MVPELMQKWVVWINCWDNGPWVISTTWPWEKKKIYFYRFYGNYPTCSFRVSPWSVGSFQPFQITRGYPEAGKSWEDLQVGLYIHHIWENVVQGPTFHQLQGSIQPVMAQRPTPFKLLWKCNPYFAGQVLWGTRLPCITSAILCNKHPRL